MEKIESNQVESVLRDDELDTVSGGFGFVERFTNPLLIYEFEPTTRPAWRATGTLRQGSNSEHLKGRPITRAAHSLAVAIGRIAVAMSTASRRFLP